jgi:hypothetical protein
MQIKKKNIKEKKLLCLKFEKIEEKKKRNLSRQDNHQRKRKELPNKT